MNVQRARKAAQQGFTLIELMIVVAIIGILAAVAIPQYQNYTIKSKLGVAMSAVDPIKQAVGLCGQEAGGVLTACTTATPAANIPAFTATKEVATAVANANGIVLVTLNGGIGTGVDGLTITMTPAMNDGSVSWCNSTTVTNAAAVLAIKKNNAAACP